MVALVTGVVDLLEVESSVADVELLTVAVLVATVAASREVMQVVDGKVVS